MIYRARRAACGIGDAAGQVILVAVGVGGDFKAHQRNADEVGHLFRLDQAHRLFRVPFGHQHQLAADGEALQEQRHFAGHVEQRHVDQRAGLGSGHFALVGQVQAPATAVSRIVRPGTFRLAGGARGVEDRRQIIAGEFGQGRICAAAVCQQRGQALFPAAIVVEHDHLAGVGQPFEPGGARRVGQHQRAFGQFDPAGQFLAAPPAVEQRGAAARHHRAHVGDDPVDRIARGNADAVAALHAVSGHQRARHRACCGVSLGKAQPHRSIDQERRVAMLRAEECEIVRQAGRRVLQHRQLAAKPFERNGFQRRARCGQPVQNRREGSIEFASHSASLSPWFAGRAPLTP